MFVCFVCLFRELRSSDISLFFPVGALRFFGFFFFFFFFKNGSKMSAKKLNLTDEEKKQLEKSFQDPQFRELFINYAKDLQSGKGEMDLEISQIEKSLGMNNVSKDSKSSQQKNKAIESKKKSEERPPGVSASSPSISIKPEYEIEVNYDKDEEEKANSVQIVVKLPELESVNQIDLEIGSKQFLLTSKLSHHLDIGLPFPVNEDATKAKFDRGTRILTVIIPKR
eukprot:TRINITY_DN6489_c0_g1_i1.p2 TRINITY_DN6489_c0_g1~~TRINITY_DN6489_c0_g1_i1.p2  ORF type:complete len:225 (+),score=50.90 TRINITY_DN6489_c0_g1_i1:56-730(+)